MRRPRRPPIRQSAAAKLRAWADQLAPRVPVSPQRRAAPLVRLGGWCWPRDEIAGGGDGTEG